MITVEPSGPSRVSLARDSHTFCKKYHFNARKTIRPQRLFFVRRGSRLRLLCKSQDGSLCIFPVFVLAQGLSGKVAMTGGPGRPLLGYIFCILAQGFCWKVARAGIIDDRCSDAFSALSQKDSLEKSRSNFSSKHTVLSSVLKQLLWFPKELHTLSKMSQASIKMTVANPIKIWFSPTFSQTEVC